MWLFPGPHWVGSKGLTFKAEGMEGREEKGRRRGEEGNGRDRPPFRNS